MWSILRLKQFACFYVLLFRFRVKEENLEFRDAAWCAKNKDRVSCRSQEYWRDKTPNDFLRVLNMPCTLNCFFSILFHEYCQRLKTKMGGGVRGRFGKRTQKIAIIFLAPFPNPNLTYKTKMKTRNFS